VSCWRYKEESGNSSQRKPPDSAATRSTAAEAELPLQLPLCFSAELPGAEQWHRRRRRGSTHGRRWRSRRTTPPAASPPSASREGTNACARALSSSRTLPGRSIPDLLLVLLVTCASASSSLRFGVHLRLF
jgi:hypothetical protein